MDSELYKARVIMEEKIFEILIQRHARPLDDIHRLKFKDIVKRLEEGLFRTALTKEEYMNLNTLESRLDSFMKHPPQNNQNQQYQQVVSSSKMMVASLDDSINSASASLTHMKMEDEIQQNESKEKGS